jgi:hypothetical protein
VAVSRRPFCHFVFGDAPPFFRRRCSTAFRVIVLRSTRCRLVGSARDLASESACGSSASLSSLRHRRTVGDLSWDASDDLVQPYWVVGCALLIVLVVVVVEVVVFSNDLLVAVRSLSRTR